MDLVSWTFGGPVSDPDQPILIDALSPSNSLSLHQVAAKTRQLIAGLRAQGIKPGDCVCVNCFNDLQYSVLYLGIIGAGAVFTGINPAFTPNELRHHFDLTKPSLLIVEPPMLDKTLAAAKAAGMSTDRIFAFDTVTPNLDASIRSWNCLLEHGECAWLQVQNPDTTVASYNPTSGTSGLPKAAMITHSYHVTQAAAQCTATDYPRSRLLTLPPFHAFGSPILPSSIRQGIPTYIMRRYAENPFLNSIAQYGVTETYVPPPVLMALPKSPLATRERLRSIRSIWMGGASVKFAQQKPLYDLLHEDACIRSVWGMTESGWITCVQDRTRREDDSVGQPLEGFEIRIVDASGNPTTADNVPGEILVRVPHPLLSYISNPAATADAFTPCRTYLRTGDIGYRLTDAATGIASMYIIDRAKELIKVRGWQVSPTEIESELMQHPAIVDAAVIGIKEANGVEEFVRAYIVRKVILSSTSSHETMLDETALRMWLRERLAGYKVPAEFEFVPAVPRNGTGKILRRVLRDDQIKPQRASHKRVDSGVADMVHSADAPVRSEPETASSPLGPTLSRIKSADEQDGSLRDGAAKAAGHSSPEPLKRPSVPQPQVEPSSDGSKPPRSVRRRFKKFVSAKHKHIIHVVVGWTHKLYEARHKFGRR
ncbi:AMP-binding enzyme [Macrophomina phaseolina]|uniref:AMP-binding enzyme n=1 Tax=Macrophomina phaseolina TaxID=35725 RepID=A0ABQ8GED5_9PEZI|nr:AMP-binding enzyme [Macrophomina phaseolina]